MTSVCIFSARTTLMSWIWRYVFDWSCVCFRCLGIWLVATWKAIWTRFYTDNRLDERVIHPIQYKKVMIMIHIRIYPVNRR